MREEVKFSVLMSVYRNSRPEEVRECLESLWAQTVRSDDVVIVIDGPIPEALKQYLDYVSAEHSEIRLCPIRENVGLGRALRHGMAHCRNELVARMDTDDVCVPDRFEKQLQCFAEDPELGVLGSQIAEFKDSVEHVVSFRNVPSSHAEICDYLKKRCPFNHMTVMFRKSEVERSGGYLDWHYNEDSYLWVRMYLAGSKFRNLDEVLVLARIDENTFQRRGGWRYYKSERGLFKLMRKEKIIGWVAYQRAKAIRFCGYVLLPNRFRQRMFKKMLRSEK